MLKKLLKYFLLISLLVIAFVFFVNKKVSNFSEPFLYKNTTNIPSNYAGIVLGTSKYSVLGGINSYFSARISAATDLYKSGKIKKILVSGDNGTSSYNEPEMMKTSLIKNGIPANDIVLDYAGFSTFDSMLRSKDVFSQNKITIISQKFHNERAVFIARKNGIDAIAFNAKLPNNNSTKKILFREYLARVKMFLDIYILHSKPKFLGKKENI